MNKKWLVSLLLVCCILAGALLWRLLQPPPGVITVETAIGVVLDRYPGSLLASTTKANHYVIEWQTEQGIYEAEVNRQSGEIESLQRLASFGESSPAPSATSSPVITPTPDAPSPAPTASPTQKPVASTTPAPTKSPTPVRTSTPTLAPSPTSTAVISSEAAGKAALSQAPGASIESVKLYRPAGQAPYYLVELDADSGPDMIVQIHAISAKVLSISWDNDNDDDDDDDDEDEDD